MLPDMRSPVPLEDLERTFELLQTSTWRRLEGRRLFITGGTGFVGKWLLSTLVDVNRRLDLNVQATVLTRDPAAFHAAMPLLAGSPELHWLQGDVRDFAFPDTNFDTIIHAATDVVACTTPENIFATCVEGTQRVLELAAQASARDLLLVSSGAVYGRQPPALACVPEDYPGAPDPLLPGSAYGEGKRAAEWLCAAAAARSGLRVATARCFAFIGPHLPLDKRFAIGNFLDAAMSSREIVIQGDGTPHRSYLYAADMAAWLWAVLLLGRNGAAYNVGSTEALSIAALAGRVCSALRVSPSIRIMGTLDLSSTPERYVPENRRAREELGLARPLPLDEAILRTARWHGRTRAPR